MAREHGIGLVNSPGLIDCGYRGELRALLLNTDPAETFRVEPGDRIAQLVLTPIVLAVPVEAAALTESSRGTGGFGSSRPQRGSFSPHNRGKETPFKLSRPLW